MNTLLPPLSPEQWLFLAVLDAFEGPITIDAAGILAPLLPGPLFDLLEKSRSHDLIQKIDPAQFAIAPHIPLAAREKIGKINDTERLKCLVAEIEDKNLEACIGRNQMLTLFNKADMADKACELEVREAHHEYEQGNLDNSRKYLQSAVGRYYENREKLDLDEKFIHAVLELSNICFALGQGFKNTETFLHAAENVAAQNGYRRHHAMISLHLGRLYYFSDRRVEALDSLAGGIKEIEELGDEDILSQSAVFIGLFYFIKGLFKDAVRYFEKAEQTCEAGSKSMLQNPTAPLFLGYCASYLGQFHRAIGSLDYNWRLAAQRSDWALASTIRSVLGTILVILGKKQEALDHLRKSIREAARCDNSFGLCFSLGGMALQHFMEGRYGEAVKYLKLSGKEGERAGLVRQFASPWFLEMFYELHRLGYDGSFSEITFPQTLDSVLNGVNIHLRGVALRLRAKGKLAKAANLDEIRKDLTESQLLLEQTGDPVQLAKTMMEMARAELKSGNREEAQRLIHQSRRLLGGYLDEFFPDEFKNLIEEGAALPGNEPRQEEFLKRYIEMIESLYPSNDPQEILANVLIATGRMFGAERSGLFWFPSGKSSTAPELRAAVNLTKNEVVEKGFRKNLDLVVKAFQTNGHQVGRPDSRHDREPGQSVRSVLCIPVEVQGVVRGVYYYDNSYLDDAFDFLDPSTMKQMASHTNLVIERRLNYLKIKEERNLLASEKSLRVEDEKGPLLFRSRVMTGIFAQADQVSHTGSTILILGETGTGKELLARRIHQKSDRSGGPFIIVDSTTIPENLLESELFGYEKGAFTGAEKRKIGRIESAHGGTLFLDEIGELPLQAQAKLLRVLQEKEFSRVGGTRTLTSDFRLIAATNRDLLGEVEKGQFRRDLYFRLSVIPIQLPPLRERSGDIVLLANYFLGRYSKKYKRQSLSLADGQIKILNAYKWPGNVRELQNIIERAVLLSQGDCLELSLPIEEAGHFHHPWADTPPLDELQRRYIAHILKKTNNKVSGPGGAADLLGMKRTSLYSRMRVLHMKKPAENGLKKKP
jgi:transcriptional regulator with GAF, ATPase, and Fis domain/tetratricopeptide (TPR) repeat protein